MCTCSTTVKIHQGVAELVRWCILFLTDPCSRLSSCCWSLTLRPVLQPLTLYPWPCWRKRELPQRPEDSWSKDWKGAISPNPDPVDPACLWDPARTHILTIHLSWGETQDVLHRISFIVSLQQGVAPSYVHANNKSFLGSYSRNWL